MYILSIELLKWGVDVIVLIFTKALKNADMHGIPSTLILRKINPIHKSVSMDLMTNYRIIMMVVSICQVFWQIDGVKIEHINRIS